MALSGTLAFMVAACALLRTASTATIACPTASPFGMSNQLTSNSSYGILATTGEQAAGPHVELQQSHLIRPGQAQKL